MNWRKSKHSMSNGHCIEITAWRKSRESFSNGACIEVGIGPTQIGIRDSTLKNSPVLRVSADTWTQFLASIKV